ncbi:MAG TPA: hypothetical protein VGI64_05455 [Streptosporangiaceae bacterium]|jgi:hypothetical protein
MAPRVLARRRVRNEGPARAPDSLACLTGSGRRNSQALAGYPQPITAAAMEVTDVVPNPEQPRLADAR